MKTPHTTIRHLAAALCITIATPVIGETTLTGDHVITGNLQILGGSSDPWEPGQITLGGTSGVPFQSIGVRSWGEGIAFHETLFGSVNGEGYVVWNNEAGDSLMNLGWSGGMTWMNVPGQFWAQGISTNSLTVSGSPVLTEADAGTAFVTPTALQGILAGALAPSSLSVAGNKLRIEAAGVDAGQLIMASGFGERKIGVAPSQSGAGTSLSIKAGDAAVGSTTSWGGALRLSSGAVNYSGNLNYMSQIEFKTANGARDNGNPMTRMVISGTGAVGIGSGAFTGMMYGGLGGLDIANGGVAATLILGAENNLTTRTNNRTKVARVAVPHYKSGEEGFAAFTAWSQGNDTLAIDDPAPAWWNRVCIGGGTSVLNAANEVSIWTGANPTTVTGTQRLTVTNAGNVGIGTVSPTSLLHVAGDGRFGGNLIVDGGGATGLGISKVAGTQVVVGRYNDVTNDGTSDRTKGAFVVGAGTNDGTTTTRKNALRVTDQGIVLVQNSGDISMGEFTAGEQP